MRKSKKEVALEWVERILKAEEKTVLPRSFHGHENRLVNELKLKGIETEIYSRVFKGEDAIGGRYGGEQEEVYFIRRLNGYS